MTLTIVLAVSAVCLIAALVFLAAAAYLMVTR